MDSKWIVEQGVTAIYIYLVPRQLNEDYMKTLIKELSNSKNNITICSYSYQIFYLPIVRKDDLFDIWLYGESREFL